MATECPKYVQAPHKFVAEDDPTGYRRPATRLVEPSPAIRVHAGPTAGVPCGGRGRMFESCRAHSRAETGALRAPWCFRADGSSESAYERSRAKPAFAR